MAGLVNRQQVTYGCVNAVIVTLGTMAIVRGIAFILSDGQSISTFDDSFRWIGIRRVLGLPVPICVLILVALALCVFLNKSIAGRNLHAIGGSPVVARLSG